MSNKPTKNQLRRPTFVGERERAHYGVCYSDLDPCSFSRRTYAEGLAEACAAAGVGLQEQELVDDIEDVGIPLHFEKMMIELYGYELEDCEDMEAIQLAYREHLARIVIAFRGRGRLDDLARACKVVEAIDGEIEGPRLAEALRLNDRFAGYSHDDVMEPAMTAIGGGIVSDDRLFPNP